MTAIVKTANLIARQLVSELPEVAAGPAVGVRNTLTKLAREAGARGNVAAIVTEAVETVAYLQDRAFTQQNPEAN